ncbi:MAG: type II toxin-antitoxin system VapC family toxin, partial [Gemmatimonadales bacterium]
MTAVYAESSAVLAWLLAESTGEVTDRALSGSDQVVTSLLTLVECCRGLARARLLGRITAAQERAAVQVLESRAAGWNVLDMSASVADRGRGAFPHEPVRTLDALHLATAAVFLDALGSLTML